VTVAAGLLAAGRGSRLGGDASKPLLPWHGRPLVAWALEAAVASGLSPLVVVVGYRADEVRAVVAELGTPATVVANPDWEDGIASSLQAVLAALAADAAVESVCIGLADQPRVGAEAYRRVASMPGELVVPTYDGEHGNPVKLARSLWQEASRLRGDVGARALARDHAVVRVDCTDTGNAADVDTLDDLERLQQEDR
jgi:CTP:molybdopterin cytidylyltransferase MocA